MSIISAISQITNIPENQVKKTLALFDDGATIPFVARYRKEVTGGLDETQLEKIVNEHERIQNFEKRRKYILETLAEKEVLTDELKKEIESAQTEQELEDLYLPYKTKRATKAEKARKAGLEPLAKMMMAQRDPDLENKAQRFVNDQFESVDDALQGARDIVAEWMSENSIVRQRLREMFKKFARIESKVVKSKKEEAERYRDYWDMQQTLSKIPSHRLLAMRRGENEDFLRVKIEIDEDRAQQFMERFFVKRDSACREEIELVIKDAYKRLLKPSLENEFAAKSKEKADQQAINIFKTNLQQLLLTAPVGEKRTLAIDPGFRTGCKLVCIDEHGDLLHNETIYPHPPQNEKGRAKSKINQLVNTFKIDAIAIGNGTAGRETEILIKGVRFEKDVEVFVVNEAGASVYSASSIARKEFPKYDVTVRGAVSIGRRLQDPLAELVKIDPKSIGVGQYQHDVDQKMLQSALDQTVINTVNQVGVELNTASEYLLQYVSGLNKGSAQKIVTHRSKINGFKSRKELLEVSGLGPKAFQQCAGFLRIRNGENVLDNTAVHPESYDIVKKMAKSLSIRTEELAGNRELLEKLDLTNFVNEEVGLPTLKDIVEELKKPGRDPRKKAKMFEFDKSLKSIESVEEGMIVPGIVTNLTNFGAFVDIGIKQNGLIHVSEIANEFVDDPTQHLHLDQQVRVKIIGVDVERKRIACSLKQVD
ncbi:Tex family protein [Salibacter halophilus]|uniref:RNA-binding transcriptional accessory protein n=1 Tax=Salibacter halophilus TaxID=1803916 RepID=A0A6N6M6L5_9FLAO|nr:Tex family protein [Salibacter halophilus]KAB1063951.1 RNA-binding transcriptional accessory protein [Salibacter halophilus]